MLTLAYKGGSGDWGNFDNRRQRGEGGSGPPFLADIIWEQPNSVKSPLTPGDVFTFITTVLLASCINPKWLSLTP